MTIISTKGESTDSKLSIKRILTSPFSAIAKIRGCEGELCWETQSI
jgi:hypothetical protein